MVSCTVPHINCHNELKHYVFQKRIYFRNVQMHTQETSTLGMHHSLSIGLEETLCEVEHPTLCLMRGLRQVFLLHMSTTVSSEATKKC